MLIVNWALIHHTFGRRISHHNKLTCFIVTVSIRGPPWTDLVYVPTDSSVQLNCTADRPIWLINVAGDEFDHALLFLNMRGVLNAHGVYELPVVGMLLVNDTEVNNQTEIVCTGADESYQTTLFVYGRFPAPIQHALENCVLGPKLSYLLIF